MSRTHKDRYVSSPAGLVTVGAFAIGLLIAPDVDTPGDFSTLAGTCAQVIAGLLVVLAVQVTVGSFRGLDLRASDVKTGLVVGGVSLIAAVAALSPTLPIVLYAPLLALAVAGGLGALVTVMILGVRVIDGAWEAASLAALRRRAELGDDAAQHELLEKGERPPRPLVSPSPSRPGRPRHTDGA